MRIVVVSALVFGIALVAPVSAGAREGERSEDPPPRVDLLTMGPGVDLYTRFGHAAFWVHRQGQPGAVYNFGYTNFADRQLVVSFLRGRALFWVARQRFARTMRHYAETDRTVYLQQLNLTPRQHRELARILEAQARPGEGRYLYHHFEDNCSTRLRDLLDTITSGAVGRQIRGQPGPEQTLRALVRRGFSRELGLLLLVDLIIGREVDRTVDLWGGTFLPRLLREAVARVRLGDGPLASPVELLYRRVDPHPLATHDHLAGVKLLWAAAAAAGALGLAMALLGGARRRWVGLPLGLVSLASGAAGLLVWSLAIGSTLPELRHNELVLSLWPSDLLLVWPAVRWLRGRLWAGRLLRRYALARLVGAGAVALGQITGFLYQRPLAWPVIGGCLAVGLWLAVRRLERGPRSTAGVADTGV